MSATAISPKQSLGSLLGAMTVEQFLADYWERQPLLVRSRGNGEYHNLLTTRIFDRLISNGVVDRRDGRLVKDGQVDPATPLFRSDGRANIAAIQAAYAEGYTIVVNNLQQRRAKVGYLCRDLERELGQQVGANAYLTPVSSQGLAPHFDNHDVYVLQCEGSKLWRLYRPPIELPMIDQHFDVDPSSIGDVTAEYQLEAGDMLYIPRGVVHVATSIRERSLHLTLGACPYRVYDVLAKVLWRAARDDVAFRRSTPARLENEDAWSEALRRSLKVLMERFVKHADLDTAIADMRSDLIHSMHPLPDSDLSAMDRLDAVGLGTRVRRRKGTVCCVRDSSDSVVIQFPGNAMSAPSGALAALEFVATVESFAVNELPASVSDDAKLVLVKRLIALGLLIAE